MTLSTAWHVIFYNLGCSPQFIRKHADDIALVWMGTPCTTWSRARKHDGGPPPLRDDDVYLFGYQHLSSHDMFKLDQGNQLLDVSDQIAHLCRALQVPWVLENPASSRIWLTPQLQSLVKEGASFITTDFCGFGMPWKKSTGLLFQFLPNLNTISRHCHTCHGRCEFTGRKHVILTGKDASGIWYTRRAQPYPFEFCHHIAKSLI